ncbi:hypothetical protein [Streptomyces sp. AM6-12]|uniref:hypothetical protein n=1 Tax=Streptomyces sp. AM6-12 TaxID=3345149 RepID=UPI0037B91CF1
MTQNDPDLRDRIAEALCPPGHRQGYVSSSSNEVPATRPCVYHAAEADAVLSVQPAPDQRAAVTPPPALTEEGRLRARVEVLEDALKQSEGLAKLGARCFRDHHDGQLAGGRAEIEGHRFALSVKLSLGTGAPWDAIYERAAELRRLAGEAQQDEHSCGNCEGIDPDSCLANPDRPRPNLFAESGVDTPRCDCGHEGMGLRWHMKACAWVKQLTDEARELLAEDDAREAQQDPAPGGPVPVGGVKGNPFDYHPEDEAARSGQPETD